MARWTVVMGIVAFAAVVYGGVPQICTARLFDADGYHVATVTYDACEFRAPGYGD